ncbi:hypothetical protein LWI29_027277 [Acer saccharum]|uniref:Leucine-rich repeat-containing N-terminal plant-type domain-containing protein n=1 Tax=Acer saccharum TaxID=4024 RepID=A0AA39SNB6_ACESA|nr:hypothetical protein LWI29_027277 [Acer saccharum]
MSTVVVVVASFFLQLLYIATIINFSFCCGNSYVGCIQSERQTLLSFKYDLTDPSNRLASWTGTDGDCCKWAGVVCNNLTGHVLELHLGVREESFAEYEAGKSSNLEGFVGMIPRQLGNLSNLRYLDLRQKYFGGLYVEDLHWLSGLPALEFLDLSGVDLSRASEWFLVMNTLPSLVVLQLSGCHLPHFSPLAIANFSSLAVLDISDNQFDNSLIPSWVSGLQNLVFLDMGNNTFRGPTPNELQNLTFLRSLSLSDNLFNSSIHSLNRFSLLEFVSLSSNSLQGKISGALENLTSINTLDLSFNGFEGRIPRSLGRLCNLRSISLSGIKLTQEISEVLDIFSGCVSDGLEILVLRNSQLSGQLTNLLGQFKSLNTLDLRDNSISGAIPSSLGELFNLRVLDLSNNKLNGTLSEIHFSNLTRLSRFSVSGNSLTMEVSPDWVPPFHLEELGLQSCLLGYQFPSWLRSQTHLTSLDISNTRILDPIPSWFWNFSSQINYLNLSHNQIHGEISNLTMNSQLESLDLSFNHFSGPLPLRSFDVYMLDLSNNFFSGSIFHSFCHGINQSKGMRILKLEENLLDGELPDCWMNYQHLLVLNLGNNKFVGNLPSSMGNLSSLQSLNLRNNNLSGPIPLSLQNCTKLIALDLSENELSGNIPAWIGERFSNIMILNLRSNKFHGLLPLELCCLATIHILDIAYNNLFGTIPRCVSNFSAMVKMNNSIGTAIQYPSVSTGKFVEDALLVLKGRVDKYRNNLNLVRMIDLSKNNLSGEIPMEVTNLKALVSLNLSYNHFNGSIPDNIGDMISIFSIDLSANKLSGQIPQSISDLSRLDHLNLSNNNLTGRIPTGTQLQSFDQSCYIGNDLCGPPLQKKCIDVCRSSIPENCTVSTVPQPAYENGGLKDGNEHEVDWFYVSMTFGFVVGFWSVVGPLIVNRRWRYAYCQFLDRLGDKFYFAVIKCL